MIPIINNAGEALIRLAQRLRELRIEHGLRQDDVAKFTGVRGKGVVANWEATAGNRRAPELTTLLLLARWYGVSLDFLMGTPGAERDSPGVKISKAVLQRSFLDAINKLVHPTPSQRIATAYQILQDTDPEAWFDERMVLVLGIDLDHWRAILGEQTRPTDSVISRFAAVAGISASWLYVENRRR